MKYNIIDHTAYFCIHVFGKDEKQLFDHAALAMFELIIEAGNPGACRQRLVSVAGNDWSDMMVNWLRELLYLWTDQENILQSIVVEDLTEHRISAQIDLEPFQKDQHNIVSEIKAVTYHQIQAGPIGDHWEAKIIFDV